jgi:trans-2-enoyl-CoA reductase
MNGRYLTLAGRIRRDLKDLEQVVQRCQAIWEQYNLSNNDQLLDAIALNLHSFYTGLEQILEQIADTYDEFKPQGRSWHKELLLQMASEVSPVRPAVISNSLLELLTPYRGFRHVVRNIYTFNLDSVQIKPLVENLRLTHQQLEQELLKFSQFLEEMGIN